MAMAASSLSSLRPSKTVIFSLLSSPKPLSKRKNHLRPKLPPKQGEQLARGLTLESQSPIPSPNPNPIQLPKEREEEEEVKSVVELTCESQTLNPIPNPIPNANPNKSSVLDLSLRFAALIFVQTVVAVWILGRGGGGVNLKDEVRVSGKKDEKGEEVFDFERVVLEIRGMAKEARAREVEEREENELETERMLLRGEGLKKDLRRGNLSLRKRLEFVRSNVRRRNVGKGFGGSTKVEERGNAYNNGGVEQFSHENPTGESQILHEPRQQTAFFTESIEKSVNVESSVLPYDKSSHVDELHNSQLTIERSESDHGIPTAKHNSAQREIQNKKRFKEVQCPSSTKSGSINGRSVPISEKKVVRKSVVNKLKVGSFDPKIKPWWTKLSFVLAILMRRGPDRSSPKGLYSLKMDSTSDDGVSASYTIVFQDQGDARNFCYLLESFFEELEDFSADVVPLTIDELEEGVRSGTLKVIVVRKGQLQLYAGQPLAEAEAALQSLLD